MEVANQFLSAFLWGRFSGIQLALLFRNLVPHQGFEFIVCGHDDAALSGDRRGALFHLPAWMACPGPLPTFPGNEETAALLTCAYDPIRFEAFRRCIIDAFW